MATKPSGHSRQRWIYQLWDGVAVGEAREAVARRRDAELFPALFSLSASKTESRWLTSMLITDMTNHKRAEAERERLPEELRAANEELVVTGMQPVRRHGPRRSTPQPSRDAVARVE